MEVESSDEDEAPKTNRAASTFQSTRIPESCHSDKLSEITKSRSSCQRFGPTLCESVQPQPNPPRRQQPHTHCARSLLDYHLPMAGSTLPSASYNPRSEQSQPVLGQRRQPSYHVINLSLVLPVWFITPAAYSYVAWTAGAALTGLVRGPRDFVPRSVHAVLLVIGLLEVSISTL